MQWRSDLKAVHRGLRLAAGVARHGLQRSPPPAQPLPPLPGRLVQFAGFGSNPGRLRMLAYLPDEDVPAGNPLVVLLHGCGQQAATFAAASGWTAFADRHRVPLLLPEQAEANNRGRCFQWFQPADTARDHGESGSIAAMTRAATAHFASDPGRVFIAGLSAGGAMAAAMLAAYPDLFAAGAVVAGLPVGVATSAAQGLLRMVNPGPSLPGSVWAAKVRDAAPAGYSGPWPRLSIWHGDADDTVAPGNADLLTAQWLALHGLGADPSQDQQYPGARHRSWGDAVELWTLPGMPHGYPVGSPTAPPVDQGGPPRVPFMLERGLSATEHIAAFWHIG